MATPSGTASRPSSDRLPSKHPRCQRYRWCWEGAAACWFDVPETVKPQVLTAPQQTAVASGTTPASFGPVAAIASVQELEQAAAQQAAPLLEKLRIDPTNAALLSNQLQHFFLILVSRIRI